MAEQPWASACPLYSSDPSSDGGGRSGTRLQGLLRKRAADRVGLPSLPSPWATLRGRECLIRRSVGMRQGAVQGRADSHPRRGCWPTWGSRLDYCRERGASWGRVEETVAKGGSCRGRSPSTSPTTLGLPWGVTGVAPGPVLGKPSGTDLATAQTKGIATATEPEAGAWTSDLGVSSGDHEGPSPDRERRPQPAPLRPPP